MSSVALWNPGGLDVPAGSVVRFLQTDDISIEPQEDSAGLPAIPAGQRLRVATNVCARILRGSGPRTITLVIEVISVSGRAFPCAYRSFDVELSWSLVISECQFPRELSRGEVQHISVTVQNCSEELIPMESAQLRWCSASPALQCIGGKENTKRRAHMLSFSL